LEADIKTQFKQLAKWLSQLVNILGSLPKIIINILSFLASKIKEVRYSLFASKAKGQVSKARRKTINFYRRPISDISHLSLIIVIILTLISGISGPIDIAGKVSTDPFVATKTASTAYVTSSERRLLEADSVATISSIYSDALGQDAIKEAEDLNNKINITSASSEYISSTPIVSMPENANSRSKITTYVVIDGDTLWSIARQFNLTTDTVRYANKLEDENSVKPGQTLTILPMVGLVHTVAQGDSLEGIAARYKASKELIISQNDLYGEDITPGMQLLVPDGEIPALPKPVVVPAPAQKKTDSSSQGGGYGSASAITRSGSFQFPTIVGSMGFYNGYHNWAIDIPNSLGTPIFAADSGRIVEAQYGYNGGYGNTILIDHGDGAQTRYAHMSSLAIIGGYVTKGQVIGYMGSTGSSTGSHLHFEIIINGLRQNPISYF